MWCSTEWGTSVGLCPLLVDHGVGDQLHPGNDGKERGLGELHSAREKPAAADPSRQLAHLLARRYVLAPTENSPGFTVGDDYVLDTLDRLHVLRALEGGGIGAADLAHTSLH